MAGRGAARSFTGVGKTGAAEHRTERNDRNDPARTQRLERHMRLLTLVALAACLVAAGACQSTTVHGTEGRSLTATTPSSLTIRRGESIPLEVGIGPREVSRDR